VTENDVAYEDRETVYQGYMNGAHNGDAVVQRAFEWWMNRTLTDLDHWAAVHGTDADTFREVLERARATEQRSGASNGFHEDLGVLPHPHEGGSMRTARRMPR